MHHNSSICPCNCGETNYPETRLRQILETSCGHSCSNLFQLLLERNGILYSSGGSLETVTLPMYGGFGSDGAWTSDAMFEEVFDCKAVRACVA